jgi:hypothetical protein
VVLLAWWTALNRNLEEAMWGEISVGTGLRNVCNGVDCVWNVMAHVQKLYFLIWRNGRVHLNRQGHQFSRLLADELCASGIVMLDTPCFEIVWRVLATHSIRQFSLHFPSRVSSCFNWAYCWKLPPFTSYKHEYIFLYPVSFLYSDVKCDWHIGNAYMNWTQLEPEFLD